MHGCKRVGDAAAIPSRYPAQSYVSGDRVKETYFFKSGSDYYRLKLDRDIDEDKAELYTRTGASGEWEKTYCSDVNTMFVASPSKVPGIELLSDFYQQYGEEWRP